jgi:hypothetical protein
VLAAAIDAFDSLRIQDGVRCAAGLAVITAALSAISALIS